MSSTEHDTPTRFHVEMVGVERNILDEIADPRLTRDDVALTYAYGIRGSEQINWRKVNDAIIERWSLSALKYIKTKAWRRIGGR